MPYDNVIIFGAGASCDAGVPLLKDFVDTMWRYAGGGRTPHGTISEEDRKRGNILHRLQARCPILADNVD